MENAITVYGTDTCKDTNRTRRHLDELKASYRYIDIDTDPRAERKVLEWNEGKRVTPTIVFGDEGDRLSAPSDSLLDAELDRRGLFPVSTKGDGSAGLGE